MREGGQADQRLIRPKKCKMFVAEKEENRLAEDDLKVEEEEEEAVVWAERGSGLLYKDCAPKPQIKPGLFPKWFRKKKGHITTPIQNVSQRPSHWVYTP